jgi:hypothetical protein
MTPTAGNEPRERTRPVVPTSAGPAREGVVAAIAMAGPFRPRELTRKIQALCHRESPRNQSPAVVAGRPETWQPAEPLHPTLARASAAGPCR